MRPTSWWQGTNKGEKEARDLDTIRLTRSPSLGKAQSTIQQEAGPPELGDFSVSSQGQSTSQACFWRGSWKVWTQAPHHHKEPASNRVTAPGGGEQTQGFLSRAPSACGVTGETRPAMHRRRTYLLSGKERPLPLGSWQSAWPADSGMDFIPQPCLWLGFP